MRKVLIVLSGALLLGQSQIFAQSQSRPDKCGVPALHRKMIANDPAWEQKLQDRKASLQAAADYYKQYKAQQDASSERTTTTVSAVPIIFHIIVDSVQFNALGGTAGIIKRCDSQIAVLNHDFNKQNADSTLIPSGWKPLYGKPGISFGLAHKDPSGNCSPGYEVKIIAGTSLTDAGFDVLSEANPAEKTAAAGLAAWDVTKYYNVWCINYTGQSTNLLGLTQSISDLSSANMDQEGVDILYSTLGSTGPTNIPPAGTGTWFNPYNLGRTLTHETGHFFEIWHPWGDDGGRCPWNQTGTSCVTGTGSDDGLGDTPPESDNVYGNPTYTITGGTYYDCCQMHGTTNTQPIGIACLSYMDYTDDDAMHMFTTDQAAAMASMVLVPPSSGTGATGSGTIGENYELTQNPALLVACTVAGVAPSPVELNSSLSMYPNPTTGVLNVTINSAAETLNNIVVMNLLGQQVAIVKGLVAQDYYSIDLSGMSKGIYFVKCNFASGSVTRKILLQ